MRAVLLLFLASRWLPANDPAPLVEEIGGPIASAPAICVTAHGATLLAWETAWADDRWIEFRRRESGAHGGWSETPARLDGAPSGATALEPRLAAAGETILLAWQDDRNGAYDAFTRRSTDGGRTWPTLEARLDATPAGESASSMISMVISDGGPALAAFEDQRGGERDIYVRRGTDGGASWDASDARLDSGDGPSYHPQIVIIEDGATLVLWWDEANGLSDLMTRRSADGGAAWESPARLDSGDPGAHASRDAAIAARGARVVVAWEDEAGGAEREIHVRLSEDGGRSWNEEKRLGRPLWARAIEDPRVAIDARGRAHVLWVAIPRDEPGPEFGPYRKLATPIRRPDPTAALFHAAIDESGVVLAPSQLPSAGPHSRLSFLGAGGGAVWAAWVGTRTDGGAVDAACSTDSGLNWRSIGLPRSQNPGGEFVPVAGLAGAVNEADGALHLAWVQGRSERARLYFTRAPIPLARGTGRD